MVIKKTSRTVRSVVVSEVRAPPSASGVDVAMSKERSMGGFSPLT